ncbi:LytTR family DNA-binding domain-containing protein [Massilia sp. TS11]|uniref:LytR/AlgR family response regulator transcription factor n=1 Tax=Massilia sp. TS11 TaxID=2908003 RepID=UPI001EDB3E43|nr:LytTR family DNA-binding domain-containing protein [Massilia sp. TS11]MCG2586057.1 LytTR family DNA-binding domain-containing protein [Massilia sp. TS11]
MTTALIVDDEAPMRDLLRARLREAWPELEIIGEASNGLEAVTASAELRPDVVFLDIRMPGQSGIEAAKVISGKAHVVFATAYDQYAIEAFEHGALDYLLKPVTADRLALTVQRVKARLHQAPLDIAAQLRELTAAVQKSEGAPKPYLRWIQAQVGTSLRMISTREILFFQADEKYTRVQTDSSEVLIRKTLKELEEELDPAEFWRIHRSTLVRVDAIAEVTRDARGRQLLAVRGHPEKLEVSRGHTHLFQQM